MSKPKYVAVVIGASKGIGLTTAKRLNALGHHVVGLAQKQADRPFPGKFLEVDLADATATAAVAQQIAQRYLVSHLINNVGAVGWKAWRK